MTVGIDKVSERPSASALTGLETIPVVQGGVSKKMTVAFLNDAIGGGGGGGGGLNGAGWTGATYDPATGIVAFTSDDGLEFTTGDLRGAAGAGWTGATYDAETGILSFTSDDGLEFTTGDLRGGGGGGGAVDSVNGQTGEVILEATDVNAVPVAGITTDLPAEGHSILGADVVSANRIIEKTISIPVASGEATIDIAQAAGVEIELTENVTTLYVINSHETTSPYAEVYVRLKQDSVGTRVVSTWDGVNEWAGGVPILPELGANLVTHLKLMTFGPTIIGIPYSDALTASDVMAQATITVDAGSDPDFPRPTGWGTVQWICDFGNALNNKLSTDIVFRRPE